MRKFVGFWRKTKIQIQITNQAVYFWNRISWNLKKPSLWLCEDALKCMGHLLKMHIIVWKTKDISCLILWTVHNLIYSMTFSILFRIKCIKEKTLYKVSFCKLFFQWCIFISTAFYANYSLENFILKLVLGTITFLPKKFGYAFEV